jgi:hypothetical protein
MEERDVPDDSIEDVADRLDRCADRFRNAGDDQNEEAAREAAEAVRGCDRLDVALRIERSFLLASGILERSATPIKPRVGLHERTGQRYVSYGQSLRLGGSRGWRNNNPGYIPCSGTAVNYGALGCDGYYAVFPDEETGRSALGPWIRANYAGQTIREALQQMLPRDEVDLNTIDRLDKEIGPDLDRKPEDLDDTWFASLGETLQADTSWSAGETFDGSDSVPDWVEALWAAEGAIPVVEAATSEEAASVDATPTDNS